MISELFVFEHFSCEIVVKANHGLVDCLSVFSIIPMPIKLDIMISSYFPGFKGVFVVDRSGGGCYKKECS